MSEDRMRGLGMMGAVFSGPLQQQVSHAAEAEAAIVSIAALLDESVEEVSRVVRHMAGTTFMTVFDACDALKRDARAWELWKASAA